MGVNQRRDGRVTVMVEAGHTYDTLRGVALEGQATVVDDPDALWTVGVNVWERYNGPYTDALLGRPEPPTFAHDCVLNWYSP